MFRSIAGVALLAFSVGFSGPVGAGPATVPAVPLGPLPRVAVPTHYRLTFTIDPTKDRFSGHDEIDVNFTEPRTTLFIHGNGIHVNKAVAMLAGGRTVAISYKQIDKSGVVLLTFAQPIAAGAATLVFDYDAPFDQSLAGLYKVVDKGTAYAFTQFENIDARRAFPGFDEPGFKTPFDVTIIAPVDDKVIANTPVVSDTGDGNGMMKWVFEPTKPLPTYLVAMAVGPLDIVDGGDIPADKYRSTAIHLRGVTAKGMGPRLKYALSLTPAIVEALENYYGVGYPYQKLDILAVPDFAAGAMENAGAVTFREQLLLMDNNASLDQRRSTLAVQAHELAHQWFGDLVTPKWWDNIWLNESFANWMDAKISNVVKPDWEFQRQILDSTLAVMRTDELPSARQIHNPVNGPDDIANAFDDITYDKGSAVLSMFENYVGKDAWQKGIHAYLTKFAFGNATEDDFIGTIAQVTGHPEIVAAFKSFVDQPGIPLLKTDLACAGGAFANVTQAPYAPIGITEPPHSWDVPMCAVADGRKICTLAAPPSASLALGSVCPKVLFPNAEGAGYYRFRDNDAGWAGLIKAGPKFDPANQITLLHNVSAGLRGGYSSAAEYFATIEALAPTARWDLLSSDHRSSFNLIDQLHDLRVTGVIAPSDIPALQAFVRRHFAARLAPLGLAARPGEKPATALLREGLVQLLVEEGRDPTLMAQLSKAADTYISSGGKNYGGIAPELMMVAMRAAVLTQGPAFADKLLDAIAKSDDEFFVQSAIYAVAGSDDPATLNKLTAMALTPQIRIGDLRYVTRYMEAEATSRPVLWQWFKSNSAAIEARVSAQYMAAGAEIQRLGCDAATKADMDATIGPHRADWEGSPLALRETDEKIDRCIAFKAARAGEIAAALRALK